jgi:ABC-type glycerol-3-phosphate transport system permease component
MMARSRQVRRVGPNGLGLLVALVTLFPIFWMVSTAFKPASEIYSLTPHPPPAHPTLANFRTVIDGRVIGTPYWNFAKNSLFATLVSVAASTLIPLLAAIALARFRFRLRTSYLIMLLIVQMLPLVAPGLVATSVFAFIFGWNEFVFALTFLGTDTAKYTLPSYVQYFYGRGSVDWGGIMAASTLFTIPVMIFFLSVQRRMVTGLVAGAVKG